MGRGPKRSRGVLRLAVLGFVAVAVAGEAERQPVYVGAVACARCHAGGSGGDQDGTWRATAHARAYAGLLSAEGRAMARLSGIVDDPQRSPICLGCHATAADSEDWQLDPGFRIADGVQCEKCHGPGSAYMDEAVMRDPQAAREAGLRQLGLRDCRVCHDAKGSHEAIHGQPPVDVEQAWPTIAHRSDAPPRAAAAAPPAGRAAALLAALGTTYKNPVALAFSPDGTQLWVACESADSVILVDPARREKLAEIAVGARPADVAVSPDGRRVYVSNRFDDTLSIVDAVARRVVRTIPVGDDPHGVLADPTGRTLFVLDTSADQIAVLDAESGDEVRRLAASRRPWSLALAPDGRRLLVTNALPRLGAFRTPSVSEITVLDAAAGRVEERWAVPEANLLLGVAWHPSGKFALATLNRTKNLVPMTRILQGWTITNGLALVWPDGRVDQVLLDEPNRCFADTTDVAFTPDGKRAVVTSAGTNRVAVLDVARLVGIVEAATDEERRDVLPNHLGDSSEFVLAHVPTGANPRGVAVAPDGRTAWVADTLDDALTVIDLARLVPAARVDLGGPREITSLRRGERLFHDARIAFQRQFSCATCHPDGHVDGLTYDIESDGIGVSPVDNRTLRGIYDTGPFKWEGTNPSLARQCGARLAVFFTRLAPFTPDELQALNDYTVTIPRPPNRQRPPGAELTPAQRRGRLLFERARANDGREIPPEGRCIHCHPPPYFTDHALHDVGTRHALDRQGEFDVPHLNNIYDSAPYLHDGMANTLEEIWTRFNPYDRHGVTNDMTKDQLNDLIEYLKTL